jgi:molybdopterin-containing oxidoreductase family membrane subunit
VRQSPIGLWVLSIAINLGMWSERFVIIVQSLERDFLPSSWHGYHPTYVDWSILAGTLCFFLLLFLAFLRFVPFIPLWEVKELKHHLAEEEHA